MKRRHFIKSVSRWSLGAALVGGGAALLAKRSKQACILDVPYCKNCKILSDCGRPQALSYKQFTQKNNGKESV